MVCLSQKPSTENGRFRVADLILGVYVVVGAGPQGAELVVSQLRFTELGVVPGSAVAAKPPRGSVYAAFSGAFLFGVRTLVSIVLYSLFFSTLYAKCPLYLVLCMQSILFI